LGTANDDVHIAFISKLYFWKTTEEKYSFDEIIVMKSRSNFRIAADKSFELVPAKD
jgi:hypothetical protein